MACAGIDFGNRNCVVAIARRGGIDICCNEVSNRATPAMVSFEGVERHIGESALTFAAKNYKNTIYNIQRLIGAHYDSSHIQSEISRLLFRTLKTKQGGVAVEVSYKDEKKAISLESVTAMLLTKLVEIASNECGSNVKDVVISVPGFFGQTHRRAVYDACRIAGIKPLRLINEHAAVALAYGIFRTADLPEKNPIKVAFVDVGEASASVCIAAFTRSKAEILSVAFEHNFGGRDFDAVLMEHFNKEFKEKYSIDAMAKPRSRLRLAKECQKLKKVLSANSEGMLSIECLIGDTDVSGSITREEFENLVKPLVPRLANCAERALAGAKLKPAEKLHAVEIVGGSTRVPLVKSIIKNMFAKVGASLKTTLNLDEAVARGCATMAAILSPAYQVRDYTINDLTDKAIIIDKSVGSVNEKIKLIKAGQSIPTVKAISFPALGPITLDAHYKSETFEGSLGRKLSGVTIDAPKEDGVMVRIKVRISANGIFEWGGAQTMKEVEETVSVEVPAPMQKGDVKPDASYEQNGKSDVKKSEAPAEESNRKPDVEMHDASQRKVVDHEADAGHRQVPNADQEPDRGQKPDIDHEPAEDETSDAGEKVIGDRKPSTGSPQDRDSEMSDAKPPTPRTIQETRLVKKMIYGDLRVTSSGMSVSLVPEEVEKCITDEKSMRAADKEVKARAEALNLLESYVYDVRSRIDDSGGDLAPYGPASVRADLKRSLDSTEEWIYSEEGDAASKEEFISRRKKLSQTVSQMLHRKKEEDDRPTYIAALERKLDKYKQLGLPNPGFAHIPKEKTEKVMKCVEGASLWLKDMRGKQDRMHKYEDPALTCEMLRAKRKEVDAVCKPIFEIPKPKPKPEAKPDAKPEAKSEPQSEAEPKKEGEEAKEGKETMGSSAGENKEEKRDVHESGARESMEVD